MIGLGLIFFFACGEAENKEKESTQTEGKKSTESTAADFNPCALQEVRACILENSTFKSCDAHRGIFGVYRDSLVNHPLAANPEKKCDASTKHTYIDKGFCPTEDVLLSYVIWNKPTRVNPSHQQMGYQVLYQKKDSTKNETLLQQTERFFKSTASYPYKRVFKCGADGKVIEEL